MLSSPPPGRGGSSSSLAADLNGTNKLPKDGIYLAKPEFQTKPKPLELGAHSACKQVTVLPFGMQHSKALKHMSIKSHHHTQGTHSKMSFVYMSEACYSSVWQAHSTASKASTCKCASSCPACGCRILPTDRMLQQLLEPKCCSYANKRGSKQSFCAGSYHFGVDCDGTGGTRY